MEAAATHGIPCIDLCEDDVEWMYDDGTPDTAGDIDGGAIGGVCVGDDEFDMVGDAVGDVLHKNWIILYFDLSLIYV